MITSAVNEATRHEHERDKTMTHDTQDNDNTQQYEVRYLFDSGLTVHKRVVEANGANEAEDIVLDDASAYGKIEVLAVVKV
jgi:hypothetical protein